MKLFKLKRKNIILVSLLAIAGVFGVTNVVIAKQTEENPIVEKALAESSGSLYGHIGSEGSSWTHHNQNKVDNNTLWWYDVTFRNGNEFTFYLSGSTWWSNYGTKSLASKPTGFSLSGANIKYTGSNAMICNVSFKDGVCNIYQTTFANPGSFNSWSTANTGTIMSLDGWVYWSAVNVPSGGQFKVVAGSTWYGDDFVVFGPDATGQFNINHNTSDDNITSKVTGSVSIDIYFEASTHYIYLYDHGGPSSSSWNGYYLVSNKTFKNNVEYSIKSTSKMNTTDVGVNTAKFESNTGTSISNSTSIQVVKVNWPRVVWYNVSLGSEIENWSNNDNKINYSGSGSHFNFYFKQTSEGSSSGAESTNGTGVIYVVDVDAISLMGYVYYASSKTAGDIHLTTKRSDDSVVLNNVLLTSVTSVESISNFGYFDQNTFVNLYKIPIYNLRGADGSAQVTKIVWNDGTETTVTGLPTAATDSPHYYERSGTATTSKGNAAHAMFSIYTEIQNDTEKSVCNIDKDVAEDLCDLYDSGDSDLLERSVIKTWASTKPTYSGSQNWPMSNIRYQLGNIAGGVYKVTGLGAFSLNTLFGNNENNLSTIIIIISSSVALLSVTALSILVIRKRKSKED